MNKPKVFVTRVIPDAGLTLLREATDVEVWPLDRPPTAQELVDNARGKDALVTLLTEKVDAALLAGAPTVRIVANVAVGFDNFDVPAATKAGVILTNTPGVLDDTTADLAFALLMATARRIPEGDRLMRTGTWAGWDIMQLLGHDVHHAKLGIIGFGRIGRGVARRAAGFGMEVSYHDAVRADAATERELAVTYLPLPQLLAQSDFISLHVPLMPETRHLLDAKAFAAMKRSAIVVNTSRGPVVDEAALVTALRDGTIAGAGLDVYEHEPKLAPGLAELDNVVLLPHIGSASIATRSKMAEIAACNVLAYSAGETPPNALNPEVLASTRR